VKGFIFRERRAHGACEATSARTREIARRDSKCPRDFSPDGEAKRLEATPRIEELARRHLCRPFAAPSGSEKP